MSFKNSLFLGEFKAQFSKQNLIIAALILLLALVGVHKGVTEYKSILAEVDEFTELEKYLFEKHLNYTDYSHIGFKVLFAPAVTGIFSETPRYYLEMTGRVNSIAALEISNNSKGNVILNKGVTYAFRLTNILLFTGILYSLLLGFTAFRNSTYGRYLVASLPRLRIYLTFIISRFIFLGFVFLIISGLALLLVFIRGIASSMIDWTAAAGHFGSLLLLLLFFLVIGGITGSIRKKSNVYLAAILVLAIFVVWHVFIVNTNLSNDKKTITLSGKLYGDKQKIIDDFETRSKRTHGDFNPDDMDTAKIVVEGYKANELPRLVKMERQYRDEMAASMDTYYCLAIWSPTTFYGLTSEAAGGKDYDSYLSFFDYLIELYRKFAVFWIERVIYHRPKDPKAPLEMVNFIKGDENIFHSRSHLPRYFWQGISINLGYIVLLLVFGYFRFSRSMLQLVKKTPDTQGTKLDIVTGRINAVGCKYRDFKDRLLAAFCGSESLYRGKLTIDGKAITGRHMIPFLYLPDPREFPDGLRVSQLVESFIGIFRLNAADRSKVYAKVPKNTRKKTMAELNVIEKADIMLEMAEAFTVGLIVFDNFSAGLPSDYRAGLSSRLTGLQEKGQTMVYFVSDKRDILDTDITYVVTLSSNKYNISNPGRRTASSSELGKG